MLTELSRASSSIIRFRLCAGYHLLPSGDGWLLCRPDGRFARLKIRPELSEAAAAVLAAESPPDNRIGEEGGVEEEELAEVLERLVKEGVAESVAEASTTGRVTGRVAIEGDGAVARLLAELLLAGGLEPRAVEAGPVEAGPVEAAPVEAAPDAADGAADIWVCCAGWLPDTRFQARDSWCFASGVAWHGFYAEGNRFHLGPFWLPEDPRTVRYADARARRLAAEVHPDGLEDYWRHLEAGWRVNPLGPPNPAEAALIAGAIAADILAWSAGTSPPSHGHQLAYDRSTGSWRRHPVLPVPRGLMTERMP